MSINQSTEQILNKLENDAYQFYVMNIANPDMVAHTGNIRAAVKACEITDECIGKIVELVLKKGGGCIITADHGNVEEMIDPVTGGIDTEHSTYPVPVICISQKLMGKVEELPMGLLADVAPTALSMIGLNIPATMNGRNLLAYIQQGGNI